MATSILNDRRIKSAKPTDKEYFLSDGNGLYLRIRPAGDKLWMLRYTNLTGRQAKKSLGPYPSVTLALARELAQEHKESLSKGVDPQSTNENAPNSIQELFDLWITQELPRRRVKRGVYHAQLRMQNHVLPYIGKDAIESVTRSKILRMLMRLVEQKKNAQANVVLIDVIQMLNYAVAHEWVSTNRAANIRKSEVGGKDRVGSRVLSPEEITELWQKCQQQTGITIQCYASIWLGLSTLARIEEMATAEEGDFDLDNNTWTIPAAKNKSSREHVIHLSPFARSLIDMLWNIPREGSPYLFKSNRTESYTRPKTLNFQISQRQRSPDDLSGRLSHAIRSSLLLTGGKWSHHDLRRSGATLMGNLGVPTEIIEKCLNHSSKSTLVRTYQKQENLSERKEAFNLLGVELKRLCEPQ